MKNIFVPTNSSEDWKELLAEPEKHWKSGYSAKMLAESWENGRGDFPPEIKALFTESGIDHFSDIELLLAFPEYQVFLPPRRRHPSQNDLFVIAKDRRGELVTIMVEGKVSENFGPRLGQWLAKPTSGRMERIRFIESRLGLQGDLPTTVRYQLLHRTVSAIVEAERFRAKSAVMLIHSFTPDHLWFEDFMAFLDLYGVQSAEVGKLYALAEIGDVHLYAGWVTGKLDSDSFFP